MPPLPLCPTSFRARCVVALTLVGATAVAGCSSVTKADVDGTGATSGTGGTATSGGSSSGGAGGASGAAPGTGGDVGAGGTLPTSCDPTLAPDLNATCIEDLGDSRVRITYDFEAAEQLQDFAMSAGGTMEWVGGSLVLTCDGGGYCAAIFSSRLLVDHATVIAVPVDAPDVLVSVNTAASGVGYGCYGDDYGLGFAFGDESFEQAMPVPTEAGTRYEINVTQTETTLTCDFNGLEYSGDYVLVPTTDRLFALASWAAQVAFESVVIEGRLDGS